MKQFSALQLFITVADAGGFTAAGERLGVSTSAISRQIAALEGELGVSLLKRTTRRVELTEAGSTYLAQVSTLLGELRQANRALKEPNAMLQGRLRIASPSALGNALIAPALADFLAVQPQIMAHLDLLDRPVDLAEEDYDLILRLGAPHDNAQPLAQIGVGLFASPGYCALHSRPHGPSDLPSHCGLFLAGQPIWQLRGDADIQPRLEFSANRIEVLKTLCLGGRGIAVLPLYLVRMELERGELLQLLDGFEPVPLELYAETPARRRQSASAKCFAKFLADRFRRLRL